MGSPHPKALRAASQEAWPDRAQTLGNVEASSVRSEQYGAIFVKFRGEMTHIWQGLRTGEWLTAARLRGYSLILLGLSVLVLAGWIVASDGLLDRNGQPIGADFSNVYAAGSLTWQGRPADAYVPALQHAAEKAVFDGRDCRSTAGTIRRFSLRWPFSSPPLSPCCGTATPPSNSRPLRWRWAACWRRPMCWTTTSWCSRSRSAFLRGMGCATASAISRSACWPRPDRAAVVAQHRRHQLHTAGLLVELTFYAFVLRRAALDRAGIAVGAQGVAQA